MKTPTRKMIEDEVLPCVHLRGHILFIGLRDYCDYEERFPEAMYETLDIDGDVNPTYIADICRTDQDVPLNAFNTIICFGVLRYVDDPGAAIRCMGRMLKVGGHLFLGVEFEGPPDGTTKYGGDKWRFTPQGARALLRDFDIVRQWQCGTTMTFLQAVTT